MFDRGREVEEANAPAEAMKGVRGTEKCVSDRSREKNQKKRRLSGSSERIEWKQKSNENRGRGQKNECLTGAVAEVQERMSDGSFRRINGKRHVSNGTFERIKGMCPTGVVR